MRGVGGCVAVAVAGVLLGAVLAASWRGENSASAWAMGVAAVAGAVTFIIGLARQQWRWARHARLVGWLLLLVPLLVPSALTLMLPAVGALFVLVVGAQASTSADRSLVDRTG